MAELFDWIQQSPRLEIHGNDRSYPDRLWSPTGCKRPMSIHDGFHCSCNAYGTILLTLLGTVADADDVSLAAATFDQLLAVPGGWVVG